MTLPTLLLLTLLFAPSPGETVVPTPDAVERVEAYREPVERLLAEAAARGRAYERLGDLCRTAPHRLAGSPGYLAAARWALQVMETDGFDDPHFEWVDVPHWVRGDVGRVELLEPAGHSRNLPMLALGGSVATPEGGLTAEVVVVDSLEACAELGDRAEGKIVLFNGPMDRELMDTFSAYGGAVGQRVRGAQEAAKVGAVGALVRTMSTAVDDNPHTGGMRYADGVPKIPTAAISTLAATQIAELTAAGERVVVHFEQDCRTLPDASDPNVVGDYRGSERPDEVLVVGGHLDCWDTGDGAHDDGGGCCQALEAVRLLKTLGLRPKRTIRVVLFANEENGLRGGRGYPVAHAEEMDRHVLAMESDSGVFTPRGFTTNATAQTNPEARAVLEAIAELLAPAGCDEVWDGSGGADVNPMGPFGTILVGYKPDRQRYFDLHHSPADTFDKVNEREINLGAGCMAALLYIVADLDPGVPRNPVAER